MVDTMFANIYDSTFRFSMNGDGIDWTESLLNNSFDYKGSGYEALMDAAKEALITGRWFLEPYFLNYQEKRVVRGKNYGKKIKIPVIGYLSIFNVFYDYSKTIDESPYIIKRHILTRKSIIQRYWNILGDKTDSTVDAVIENKKDEMRYSNYDFNRVKHIIAYEEQIGKTKNLWANLPTQVYRGDAKETIDSHNTIFDIDFEKNKLYEIIEYSDEDVNIVLLDGKELFKSKRTLGIDGTLVAAITYNKIPWTSDSLGISSMSRDSQMMSNTLLNIYLDNLKMSIAPMFESVGWLNSFTGASNRFRYEPYKVVSTNTPWALRKIDLTLDWFEPLNAIQFIVTAAREKVGINEYAMGTQGKVERTPWGVENLVNSFKARLLPLVNSINDAMSKLSKILLLMYATYFKNDELQKLWLTGELDYDKLLDENNVTFNMSALALLEKEESLQYLADNLWVILNMAQDVTWQPTVDMKEVLKAILTKEVDIEKILTPPELPQQEWWLEALLWWEQPEQEQEQTPEDLINSLM